MQFVSKQVRAFPPEFMVVTSADGRSHALFCGPDAKQNADEYVAVKNAGQAEAQPAAETQAEEAGQGGAQ